MPSRPHDEKDKNGLGLMSSDGRVKFLGHSSRMRAVGGGCTIQLYTCPGPISGWDLKDLLENFGRMDSDKMDNSSSGLRELFFGRLLYEN